MFPTRNTQQNLGNTKKKKLLCLHVQCIERTIQHILKLILQVEC